MKFNKVQFVYIDMDYLKKLNEVETEIFYDENNANYKEKPHLGILFCAVCLSNLVDFRKMNRFNNNLSTYLKQNIFEFKKMVERIHVN